MSPDVATCTLQMCAIPVGVVTHHSKVSGFKQHNFILLQFGGLKSEMRFMRAKIKVLGGLEFLTEETCFLAFFSI